MISELWEAVVPASRLGGVSLLVGMLIVLYIGFNRYGHRLNSVPGPFAASVSSYWKFYKVWGGRWPQFNHELHQKYGPVVRIGPKHVSIASLESVNAVHVKKKGFQKTKVYEILQPLWRDAPLHNVFSTQDQTHHTSLKRAIGNLYTMSSVMKYEPNLDRSLDLFTRRLREVTQGEKRPVDMCSWLQFWTFDALGEINFSQTMGFLEAGKDLDGVCELDHEMMVYFGLWGQIPKTEKILSRISTWTRVLKPNPLFNFTLDIVKSRLDNPSEKQDMLNALIHVYQTDSEKLNLREVHGASYINVVTAHDVLAISLRAVVYYLAKNPQEYKRFITEIREADANGQLSSPAKYTEISGMVYLSAVIDESLRIHPSTGTMFERYVPEGGVLVHDKFLPEGTTVGVNAWVMNRDPEVFGSDVESFRPERWIKSSPEQVQQMRKCLGTWGYGARGCIGKNMAMMQMTKVLVELYRHFDIELKDPEKEWSFCGNWLTRQSDMETVLTPLAKAS